MNKIFISILVLGIISMCAIGARIWYLNANASPNNSTTLQTFPQNQDDTTQNQNMSQTPTNTQVPATTTASMQLRLSNGNTVAVRDFIHNGETAADVVNPGEYFLAGSVGYCLANGTCPGGTPGTNFRISYNASRQSFTIILSNEPLKTTRLEAERYMETKLGVTATTLCSLNYYVGVLASVNSFYSGENLGFSQCPGATVLP